MKMYARIVVTCAVVCSPLGFLGVAGAENKPSPSDNMKPFSVTDQTGFKEGRVRGEVLSIEGAEYVIKNKDGKEVRVHKDDTTNVVGEIKKGSQIEVEVDDKHHALSIKPFSSKNVENTQTGKPK